MVFIFIAILECGGHGCWRCGRYGLSLTTVGTQHCRMYISSILRTNNKIEKLSHYIGQTFRGSFYELLLSD